MRCTIRLLSCQKEQNCRSSRSPPVTLALTTICCRAQSWQSRICNARRPPVGTYTRLRPVFGTNRDSKIGVTHNPPDSAQGGHVCRAGDLRGSVVVEPRQIISLSEVKPYSIKVGRGYSIYGSVYPMCVYIYINLQYGLCSIRKAKFPKRHPAKGLNYILPTTSILTTA